MGEEINLLVDFLFALAVSLDSAMIYLFGKMSCSFVIIYAATQMLPRAGFRAT